MKKTIDDMRVEKKVALVGIGLGALYWILESAMHAFLFHKGTFVQQLLTPNLSVLWIRLLVLCVLTMFIAYARSSILQRRRAEEEKERMQAQLLQVQKMQAIGTLVSGVAHEFNNLLGAIQGYTELAMEEIDEADPSYGYLKRIGFSAECGGSLVRQLLLVSLKQPMEPTLLNINRIVDHLVKMLKRLIREDIAINIDLEPDLWPVRADEARIEQLIMNLAVNAREAMPKGGKLTIKTENVTLSEDTCKVIPEARFGRYVRLSIADTGVGMDEEIMQHIFEPFFTTKEPGEGVGLGLSVAYGIVKQHEGWIDVHSEPGQGSTFVVYLPALAVKPEDEFEEEIS